MVHADRPDAIPVRPVLVDHLTSLTPTLSAAVPEIRTEAARVATDVPEGLAIDTEGAVLS
jgi:hypothetical protein